MGNKMFEGMKIDVGVAPVSINGNSTSLYYNLADYRKAIAVLEVGAMAITKTAKLEVYQAKNAAAGSAKLLTGATATITANTNVTSLTLALSTVLAGHTVTVNGLLFTAHANTTTPANREFDMDGTDSEDADDLCTCLNDATYGIAPLGLTAVNVSGTVTITSTVPGAALITATSTGGTITVGTLKGQVYVEIDALTLESGFTHIATKVTTDDTMVVSSLLLRGGQRVGISQKVGASASV